MTCTRWHRLGERCECGHVTVPAQFYHDEATQEQAEARYMEFLEKGPHEAAYGRAIEDARVIRDYKPPFQKLVTKVPASVTKRGRPKQYRNAAERQKAYRGRK